MGDLVGQRADDRDLSWSIESGGPAKGMPLHLADFCKVRLQMWLRSRLRIRTRFGYITFRRRISASLRTYPSQDGSHHHRRAQRPSPATFSDIALSRRIFLGAPSIEPNPQTHPNTQTLKHPNTQTPKYSNTQTPSPLTPLAAIHAAPKPPVYKADTPASP